VGDNARHGREGGAGMNDNDKIENAVIEINCIRYQTKESLLETDICHDCELNNYCNKHDVFCKFCNGYFGQNVIWRRMNNI
jgi:hypothetical protein